MKVEFFKTTFATYFLYEQGNILEQLWTNPEGEMFEDNYKEDMLNYLKFVEEKNIRLALINLKSFFFTITNNLQEWVDKHITAKAGKNIQKIAFIMPSDMIESLSVELTMDEEEAKKNKTMLISYFDDVKEAVKWLLN